MKYKVLMSLVIIALMFTSVLPGCNEGQQLVIPSSMEPSQIFMEVCNTTPPLTVLPFAVGECSPRDMTLELMPNGTSEGGFINGLCSAWPACFYTMRSGKAVDSTSGQIVLSFVVLKYENAEFAEKSFANISTVEELQDLTYKGVALKAGVHSLPQYCDETWGVIVVPCCLVRCNRFIIYIHGREDVDKDILDRIIAAFGVKE